MVHFAWLVFAFGLGVFFGACAIIVLFAIGVANEERENKNDEKD